MNMNYMHNESNEAYLVTWNLMEYLHEKYPFYQLGWWEFFPVVITGCIEYKK